MFTQHEIARSQERGARLSQVPVVRDIADAEHDVVLRQPITCRHFRYYIVALLAEMACS
jgi:hypothetical protein